MKNNKKSRLFAVFGENLWNGAPCAIDDSRIEVGKRQAGSTGNCCCHAALARAHEADEEDRLCQGVCILGFHVNGHSTMAPRT